MSDKDEGWRVVPVVPTLEMQKAGYEVAKLFFSEYETPIGHFRIYEAMLAAAPQSPAKGTTNKAEYMMCADAIIALSQSAGAAEAGRNVVIEECAQIADKYWAREVASQIRALTQPPDHRR